MAEKGEHAGIGSFFEDADELRNIRRRLEKFFQWEGLHDGEELTDDTMFRVVTRIATGAEVPREKLEAFFFGVARNVAFEARQRQQQWSDVTNLERPATTRNLDTEIWIAQCLAKLSADDQALLLATVWKSTHELSEEMGISEVHVRVRLHNARTRLRQVVRDEEALRSKINRQPLARHSHKE